MGPLRRSGVTSNVLHLIVPGPLEQRTGGYVYDARMVAGLRDIGWGVEVRNLEGRFPEADDRGRESLGTTLAELPDRALVIIDGLAMGGLPEALHVHRDRLRMIALVHHPLADETGIDGDQASRFARLEREALSACSGVIATSGFTAARVREYGVPAERVRAVPPGVEPANQATGPGPGEPPRLLCVATVTPRKGHLVLVRALARLTDQPWSCMCVGSLSRAADHAAAVQAEVRQAGLDERIRFVGECDPRALDSHYHGSSVFVLPSYYEGYGMVLTEALVRGLPIVSTTGGGIPYTVPDGAGILVTPGDDEALAGALAQLLSDDSSTSTARDTLGAERRSAMSSEARRHGGTLPDWEEAARAFAEAIGQLVVPAHADTHIG